MEGHSRQSRTDPNVNVCSLLKQYTLLSTNICLQHRRERGRAAQAAFRKRQIDTIRVQEQQLRLFNQLLRDVSEATSKLKLTIQLTSNSGEDDVSKHVVKGVVHQLEQAVQRLPQTGPLKGKADNEDFPTNPAAPAHQEISSQATFNTLSSERAVMPPQVTPVGQAESTSPVTQPISNLSIPMSSLLVPPIETIPYLSALPGSKPTFASKLYWATMSLAYRLACDTEQLQTAPRLLLYHLRLHTAESIAGRVGKMLLNESTGVVHQDSAPDFTYRMIQHIVRDLVLEGEDVKRYLDAREVELYFWRRGVDPVLLGVEDADWRLGQLLQELSRNSVCFGDGPRYRIDDVEKAFLNATGWISVFPCLNS